MIRSLYKTIVFFVVIFAGLGVGVSVNAASVSVSPSTGVYTIGNTFTVSVLVNTSGKSINAADGTVSFDPSQLSVVAVSRGSSIFSLWTTEPTFSNSAGTITFSGGSPSGYTGAAGTIMTVTFRTLVAGTARITMSGGSVLAADGRGTNVLTNMNSGTYTVTAASSAPAPEVVVEFVPSANTPTAPKVTSVTHPADGWSKSTTAELTWTVPAGVTAVRTSLDSNPTAIPTKVYDTPISSLTLRDLDEGISYLHIQFKNADGWGKVTHYRLAVDGSAPENFSVSLAPDNNLANPSQTIIATTTSNNGAPIKTFKVQVDGGEIKEFTNPDNKNSLTVTDLAPGAHNLVIEAIDEAGNSAFANLSITIEAFDAPVLLDVPVRIPPGIIPAITGKTRGGAEVTITVFETGVEPKNYTVTADESGQFRFIPDNAFATGVYTLTVSAKDQYGAQSVVSAPVKLLVEQSGILRVGSYVISFLTVFIPLIALLALLVIVTMYTWYRVRRLRQYVDKEAVEVSSVLSAEFTRLQKTLHEYVVELSESRKTNKLTTSEEKIITLVTDGLNTLKQRVNKEVKDVTDLVE